MVVRIPRRINKVLPGHRSGGPEPQGDFPISHLTVDSCWELLARICEAEGDQNCRTD